MAEFEDDSFVSYSYDALGRRVYREEMSWKDFGGIKKGHGKENGKGNGQDKQNGISNGNGNNNGNGNGKATGMAKCNDNSKGNGPFNNPGKGKKIGLYKNGKNGKDHVYDKETTYLYEGLSNVLNKEYSATGSPYAEYYKGPNGQLTSRKMFGMHGLSNPAYDPNLKTTGGLLYYQYDGMRNVSEVTDRNGDLIERYRYDAFGGIFTGTTAPYNYNGYAGMSYEGKTSLIDMNARWYDPTVGHFMTDDSYQGDLNQPQTLNRYAYALNNPVNNWDPTGHIVIPIDMGSTYQSGASSDNPNGIPDWVRVYRDNTVETPLSPTAKNIEYWKTVANGHTEVLGEAYNFNKVKNEKNYVITYNKDKTDQWKYSYSMDRVQDGISRQMIDPTNETFMEKLKYEYTQTVSAKDIAGLTMEEIEKYGTPPIVNLVGVITSVPSEYKNMVLRQQIDKQVAGQDLAPGGSNEEPT